MSVSPLHVYLEFLAERNAADLLEILGLGEYAVGAVIRIEKAAFTEVAPVERRADVVIFIDGPNPLVLIFEIQLRRDQDKPTAWNSYIAHAYARWKCQVALVVLTPSDAVATWASQPISPHIGSSWTPFVLGPADMPLNWTVQDVSERLDLAILCAATHGNKREAEQLCTQVWHEMVQRMDGGRIESTRYTDYLDVLASVATRHWVQGFLEKDVDYIRLSERLEKKDEARGRNEGIALGRNEALRTSIRTFAAANGVQLDEASLQRLDTEDQLATLQSWVGWIATQREGTVTLP